MAVDGHVARFKCTSGSLPSALAQGNLIRDVFSPYVYVSVTFRNVKYHA